LFEVINVLHYFSLCCDAHSVWVSDWFFQLFELHHFEDVGWQKHSDLLPVVGLVFKQQDDRAKRIMVYDEGNRYFHLIILNKCTQINIFPIDFIVIGVENFSLYFCEN